MSTKPFSYQWASQEELDAHVPTLSRQAINAVLRRYRLCGNKPLVQRIELAILNAKIANLLEQAGELRKAVDVNAA
jgi:hypothetical protein